LSPARRRVFFLIAILFPVALLSLVELTLRAAHYCPDLSAFTTETFSGRSYWVLNAGVKSRYFNRVDFSPNTSFDCFSVPKPRGTFRIFCLGGFTTVGYPYGFVGSFSTFLRDRLRRIFPNRSIEVINLGLTATKPYTVNDLAREVVSLEPDLLIVYDGPTNSTEPSGRRHRNPEEKRAGSQRHTCEWFTSGHSCC
jgi:hypothetical protein